MKSLLSMLGMIVLIVGFLVLVGWTFDIDVLKRIAPGFVTMKGNTAICFVMTGLTMLCFMEAVANKTWAQVIVVVTCLWKMVLMLNVLYDFAGGQPFQADDNNTFSVGPGIPSLGTVIGFIVSALVGMYVIWKTTHLFVLTQISGFVIALLGLIALLGYALDVPQMYYYIDGKSTAMAIHTAILFVIIGVGFATIKRGIVVARGSISSG